VIQTPFTLPTDAVAAVTRETREYGAQLLETGGFLVARGGSDALTGVAVAGGSGIVRHRRLFQISERALDSLFTFADDGNFWIPVQFHSHQVAAFMSETDAQHGLRVEGFVSAIIPNFASPSDDVSSWGWWQFHNRDWYSCAPVAVHSAAVDLVVVFDEDGVREP
jgi:hypothetical protein